MRAEILGAFFNATFLIALCVTICLEAIQRFFDPPEIKLPELVLAVGCFGLASNLLGFWILGGHGHGHGHDHGHEHDHDHDHGDGVPDLAAEHESCRNDMLAAEEGRAQRPAHETRAGSVDLYAEAAVARYQNPPPVGAVDSPRHISFQSSDGARDSAPDGARDGTSCSDRDGARSLDRGNSRSSATSRGTARGRASSVKQSRLTSIDDISIHPASFRQEIQDFIAASTSQQNIEEGSSDASSDHLVTEHLEARESTPLLLKNSNGDGPHDSTVHPPNGHRSLSRRTRHDSAVHDSHHHNRPKEHVAGGHGHGHSHGDMGMNAMVLHVIGDALGNLGVIITALVIWKTTSPYRFYADPIVSLIITLIILKTAIPLVKATSKILLQATPDHINIRNIREDIEDLPGVVSCHHIHVWQLSDTKIVCSMHLELAFPITEDNGERYMALAKRARKCLHAHGIHSATIQAEFSILPAHLDGAAAAAAAAVDPSLLVDGPTCLMACVDRCPELGCCNQPARAASRPDTSGSSPRGSVVH